VYGAGHLTWLASRTLALPLRDIASALSTPILLNLAVMLLWSAMELALPWLRQTNNALYICMMLLAGGALFIGLFFLVPFRDMASEKARWIAFLRRAPI
jgi:hypothetical protein